MGIMLLQSLFDQYDHHRHHFVVAIDVVVVFAYCNN